MNILNINGYSALLNKGNGFYHSHRGESPSFDILTLASGTGVPACHLLVYRSICIQPYYEGRIISLHWWRPGHWPCVTDFENIWHCTCGPPNIWHCTCGPPNICHCTCGLPNIWHCTCGLPNIYSLLVCEVMHFLLTCYIFRQLKYICDPRSNIIPGKFESLNDLLITGINNNWCQGRKIYTPALLQFNYCLSLCISCAWWTKEMKVPS